MSESAKEQNLTFFFGVDYTPITMDRQERRATSPDRAPVSTRLKMSKPVFDAGSFVEVNLSDGTISSREKDRLALISTEILKILPPSDELRQAATQWGRCHGAGLDRQLKSDAEEAGIEALAEHLGGTLATLGLGCIRLEIRRDALLFRWSLGASDAPLEGERTLLIGFLSGYLSALSGRPFEIVDLGTEGSERLFWALSPETAPKVRAALETGVAPFAVVETTLTGRPEC